MRLLFVLAAMLAGQVLLGWSVFVASNGSYDQATYLLLAAWIAFWLAKQVQEEEEE